MKLIKRELRDEVEAAAGAQKPEPVVAQRRAQPARLEHVVLDTALAVADHSHPEGRARQTEHAEEDERGPQAERGRTRAEMRPPTGIAVCRTPRAKPRSEAGNHCITARPLAALTLAPAAPARPTSRTSDSKLCAEPAAAVAIPQAPSPVPEHEPLTEAVGEQPPRQERQQRSDPEAVEHDANLQQAQPERVAQLRGQHRQADDHGREGGLRSRPRREDEPAVTAQHRPNAIAARAARLAPWPSA